MTALCIVSISMKSINMISETVFSFEDLGALWAWDGIVIMNLTDMTIKIVLCHEFLSANVAFKFFYILS